LLTRLIPGARILDVCCGTGTIAQHLIGRGFAVTGIDASEEMLRYAIEDVPKAKFLVADARSFSLPAMFDGALCTFDSLSYMIDSKDLECVISNVYDALRPGGVFVFDLSLEEVYKSEWQQSCSIVQNNEAYFVRGSYDGYALLGRTLITKFARNGNWERTDVTFLTRCYAPGEVFQALERSGFQEALCHRSNDDEELRLNLGPGVLCGKEGLMRPVR
nr:class I SAM-dependent methyltransferase [Candidatus Eremiobacteraeota bacterium]